MGNLLFPGEYRFEQFSLTKTLNKNINFKTNQTE